MKASRSIGIFRPCLKTKYRIRETEPKSEALHYGKFPIFFLTLPLSTPGLVYLIDYTQMWWVVNTRVTLVKTFSCFTKIKIRLTHRRMFWFFLTHLARNIWRTFCLHILASNWSPLTKPHSHWLPPSNRDWQLRFLSSFLKVMFLNHHLWSI